MSGSAFAVTHYAFSSGAGRTSDGNGSHASTLKSPSYTKSVSWQHYLVLNQYVIYRDELIARVIDKNGNNMKYKHLILSLSLIMLGPLAHAEEIGSVDTVFKMIGPDHKIVVEAFDDPDVKNVTCYVSRAKTGGIKGGLGLAEDTSDAAISCQQVGPIELSDRIKNGKAQGEVVFKKRTSLVFKSLQVVRFYDAKRNALAYLAYSDKVVEGSPKNAISAVPVMPWRQ